MEIVDIYHRLGVIDHEYLSGVCNMISEELKIPEDDFKFGTSAETSYKKVFKISFEGGYEHVEMYVERLEEELSDDEFFDIVSYDPSTVKVVDESELFEETSPYYDYPFSYYIYYSNGLVRKIGCYREEKSGYVDQEFPEEYLEPLEPRDIDDEPNANDWIWNKVPIISQ